MSVVRYGHSMPFGANLLPEGGVRFALWAPGARQVELLLEAVPGAAEQVLPARAEDGASPGLYTVESLGAGAGSLYRWRIDGALAVPDPASRFNPAGPHGASEVIDPRAYAWHVAESDWTGRDWHECVVYELHVGCFTPEGSYEAALQRLPELLALGVTVIELMPLADFPGRFGWGYDGVLPYAPHPAYGRPEALKALVEAAHQLGLAVWLDVVYNHFGPDGNHLQAYAPAFFSQRHRTAWGEGLNFDGPDSGPVREFVLHNALHWLEEYRLDGLRIDATHAIADGSPVHLLQALSERVRQALPGRRIQLVLEDEGQQVERAGVPGTPGRADGLWHDPFHHAAHALLTGERQGYYAPYAEPLQDLGRLLAGGSVGAGAARRVTAAAVPTRWVNFLQNHDQIGNRARGERLSRLADPAALRLMTAVCLLAPGIPMLFMGEEDDEHRPFLYFADWGPPLREAVREGRAREFAAFLAEGGAPLSDPCDPSSFLRSHVDPVAARALPEGRRRHEAIRGWIAHRRHAIEPRLPRLQVQPDPARHGRRAGPDAPEGWPHEARCLGQDRLRVRWRFEDGEVLELRGRFGAGEPVEWQDEAGTPALIETEWICSVGSVQRSEGAGGRGPIELFGAWSGCWRFGREDPGPGAGPAPRREPGG